MAGELRRQSKFLAIFSNLEIANAAGKATFKSAWRDHEKW